MVASQPDSFAVAIDLRQVEELLGRLPGVPFFAKDRALRYIAVNDAMLRLCGCTQRGSLIGRRAISVFPRPLACHYEALDLQVLATRTPLYSCIELSRRPSGSPVWLQFSRVPFYDLRDSITGILAVARELPGSERRAAMYRRVAKISRELQRAPQQPLVLRQRAKALGLSESQLERDFHKVFGVSPREFHARARLDLALTLLRDHRRIAQVAHACGYSDHSAFTRKFKSSVGVTPREYLSAVSKIVQR